MGCIASYSSGCWWKWPGGHQISISWWTCGVFLLAVTNHWWLMAFLITAFLSWLK